MNERRSSIPILILVLVILVIVGGIWVSAYNRLVSAREQVERSYADIGTQLQRRSDLIPNLVNTVKGYMEHEQNIIDAVTQSRERLLRSGNISDRAQADAELSAALSSLLVNVENYPELTSSSSFIQLQDELAGTENRIAVARRDYNEAVGSYNALIQKFPNVLLAGILGFERAEYFRAAESAGEVPNASF